MTLRTSRLRELDNPNLSVGGRAELCCELAREFEDKGEYEEAREVLSRVWPRIGDRPKLAGLESNTAAEVLLRAGVLTGVIGSEKQITNAQETAKNLITESLTIFETHGSKKKIAEAQAELALCYWRTGEVNDARDLLEESLSRLTVDSELRGRVVVRLAIMELEATHYNKGLRILTDYAVLFQKINNQTVKGSYHVTLGNMLEHLWETEKRIDYLDRSLVEYAAASYHFERAQHRLYLANVENNLGLLYFTIHRYAEAHEHLDRARRVMVSLKNSITIAQVDETRARVFLAQGHVAEAERAAYLSVHSLEKSDRDALLVESLITHGRVQARLERYSTALSTFRRAIVLAEQTGTIHSAAQAALTAFQEMGDHLAVLERGSLMSGRTFNEEMRALEHELLKHALENAEGSVARAARNLGMSHQSFTYMLNRHRDLLEGRSPVYRRSRKGQ